MSETLNHLRRVRELLDKPEAWCKGTMYGKDGSMCLIGAVIRAEAQDHVADAAVRRKLRAQLSPDSMLDTWNDAPERTHADVLALLDRAIAAEEVSRG